MERNLIRSIMTCGMGVAALILSSCNGDDAPVWEPERSDIAFTVGDVTDFGKEELTRAEDHIHIPYDIARHPATMSGFGIMRRPTDSYTFSVFGPNDAWNDHYPYYNCRHTTTGNAMTNWQCSQNKLWRYSEVDRYDFFAAMPYNAGVRLTDDNEKPFNHFSLLVPVGVPTGDSRNAPLFCHEPVTRFADERLTTMVPLRMDQIYTRFNIVAMVDSTHMTHLRKFEITDVLSQGGLTNMPNLTYQVDYDFDPEEKTWSTTRRGFINVSNTESTTVNTIMTGGHVMVNTAENSYVDENDLEVWVPVTEYYAPIMYDEANAKGYFPTLTIVYNVWDHQGLETRHGAIAKIDMNNIFTPAWLATHQLKNNYTLKIYIDPNYLYILSDNDEGFRVVVID